MNTRNRAIRKCAVDGCLSESNREEDTGVTFHRIPNQPELRSKWLSLCHIIADADNKKPIKLLYVCSRHFLRVDFCNFKGKKYMLKQGVLPSVFPWDKSKLDAIKVKKDEATSMETDDDCNAEEKSDNSKNMEDNQQEQQVEEIDESQESGDDKSEENKDKPKVSNRSINFAINSRIEALDFNNTWYPARIVEEDYEENEVLIHFEKFSNKYDEWICMDSPRLRPLQSTSETSPTTNKTSQNFTIGERCLASWSDARKFPATITKVLANDSYEVLFDDGFIKTLKAHRISKAEGKQLQSSPLFDPVQGSKQERREKKRKIDIAALFGKRQKLELQDDKNKTPPILQTITPSQNPIPEQVTEDEIYEPWVPEWENGRPVGIDSKIDIQDGIKKSIIVPDPRLPIGWVKHLTQRVSGASAGKWDTIIMSPDHRRFRSRSEIKQYLEETKIMKYNWSMFDFSIHRHRNKRKDLEMMAVLQNSNNTTTTNTTVTSSSNDESINSGNVDDNQIGDDQNTDGNDEEENSTLKIPVVNDGYECPIDGCKKIFRKENLAQMHIKHYHPEYTKYLNSTPNVADLAYARTVGDLLLDKQVPPQPQQQTTPNKTTQIKPIKKQELDNKSEIESQQQSSASSSPMSNKSHKDSEILKLLNNKNDNSNNNINSNKNGKIEDIQPLPSGLPSSMYPDIKLKDLLKKSEGIPPNDLNLKLLSTTRPPSGIKTLLPVVRNNEKNQQTKRHSKGNNDKFPTNITPTPSTPPLSSQLLSSPTTTTTTNQEITETPQELSNNDNNDIIIEGGKVIKIVRMKQEEIINCTCGYTEEDGLMIQCDLCLCWQHAFCNNIYTENQVPEKYVCYICQNPLKQRLSKKYYHDQDWLKQGVLPTGNYHTKDEDLLNKRFNKLKKSHDISGGLLELKDFVNTVKFKLKIAEAKNHPKLYLWSKPWNKVPTPDKIDNDDEDKDDKTKIKNDDCIDKDQSLLVNILKNNDSNGDNKMVIIPKIPQPEAAINSTDCRLNLLEHIQNVQTLIDERLDDFEKQLNEIDDSSLYQDINDNDDEVNYPKIRQTTSLLMKNLETLNEFSQITTL